MLIFTEVKDIFFRLHFAHLYVSTILKEPCIKHDLTVHAVECRRLCIVSPWYNKRA